MKRLSFSAVSGYSPVRTTRLLLRGSLVATCLLSVLIVLYDTSTQSVWLQEYLGAVAAVLLYLIAGEVLLRRGKQSVVNWMLIVFYEILALVTLFVWGLNAPVGILTISFAVILPSLLTGARSILPVALITITGIFLVQMAHSHGVVNPDLSLLSRPSSSWDVVTYSTILTVFALVSWLASSQRERNLARALRAEAILQAQKDTLRIELEKESAALRQAQLEQMQELHKFALLGQSTAATLHDLSNHLSVLNLDIDDLHQQLSNSKAIAHAKESIRHVNSVVRQARHQLNSYDQKETFSVTSVVRRSIEDARPKFAQRNITLTKSFAPTARSFRINGSSLAFMQIISILLNNAYDACGTRKNSKVQLIAEGTKNTLRISVIDNGPGVDDAAKKTLFKPTASSKPTGMGVGLYIARHLVETQFSGSLELVPSASDLGGDDNDEGNNTGAHFLITIRNR